jgi:hypothetical protein
MNKNFRHGMNRRRFIERTAVAGCAALAWPMNRIAAADMTAAQRPANGLRPLMHNLLLDWCDALVRLQVRDDPNPAMNGMFHCPACSQPHGRCGDAVFPLLYAAKVTGQARYSDAAVAAVNWLRNTDSPDGSWTNDLAKNSWKGITVFASIAQAEAIDHYGSLIDGATKERWLNRLKLAADFIHKNFSMHFANINYGITGSYALALLGRLFGEAKYRQRAHELAHDALAYISKQNHLITGEAHPQDEISPRGCPPVDLGYNVEESLPSLTMYALLENDPEILDAVTAALKAHLDFMLPDGAWDNSWGTRNYKWTYWGSRTSDGCQPAYLLLAGRHPEFATAALRNTQLMRDCTHDGLLHGGPHYHLHGAPPCVHHTFTHAKALAKALDDVPDLDRLDTASPLPRETASGVREFAEINTFLAARGPWRATVTAYDLVWRTTHATGGALALLHHRDVGTLCASSLAKYEMPEGNNMQPIPDGFDFPLTPRVETRADGKWHTNLWDLTATISREDTAEAIEFHVETHLLDETHQAPAAGPMPFRLTYRFTDELVKITARPGDSVAGNWSLVVPVVSPKTEAVRRVTEHEYEVAKAGGRVSVKGSGPVQVLEPSRERVFNLVPGFEAVPFVLQGNGTRAVECTLSVRRA